ncbi:MAG: hypothetical protein R3335_10175 [Anaerolineales bacterium]|nr:hypothetical protein [Anaerolineales bacterium]
MIDSLLALLVVIGLAYGLDYWIQALLVRGYRTFDMAPYLNGSMAGNLAMAMALLFLAWFVRFRGRRGPLVGLLFLLVGLLITLLPLLLLYIPGAGDFLSAPEIRVLRVGFLYSSSISRLQITGAFAAVLGASVLLPRNSGRLEWIWTRIWQAG